MVTLRGCVIFRTKRNILGFELKFVVIFFIKNWSHSAIFQKWLTILKLYRQGYLWNLNLINNMAPEEIIFFLGLIVQTLIIHLFSFDNSLFYETIFKNYQISKWLTLIYNSYLIRESFSGYRCESGIAFDSWRIVWNYAYSPISVHSIAENINLMRWVIYFSTNIVFNFDKIPKKWSLFLYLMIIFIQSMDRGQFYKITWRCL